MSLDLFFECTSHLGFSLVYNNEVNPHLPREAHNGNKSCCLPTSSRQNCDRDECGYCTPGFLMSAKALLDTNPQPTDGEIREALSGNLCRCNAYGRILQSVRTAAARR